MTVRALGPLLGYLRGLGVAPPASRLASAGRVEELLSSFRRYLEQERGLVPAAARGYVDKVRPSVAPHHGLTTGGITYVVAAAARRAGLGQIHAHRLRHTAASEMLRAGARLPEVGQVLRHRRAVTTAIYATVDREALRQIARPRDQ